MAQSVKGSHATSMGNAVVLLSGSAYHFTLIPPRRGLGIAFRASDTKRRCLRRRLTQREGKIRSRSAQRSVGFRHVASFLFRTAHGAKGCGGDLRLLRPGPYSSEGEILSCRFSTCGEVTEGTTLALDTETSPYI